MALINCPECNQEISEHTNSCPHCGYPIKTQDELLPQSSPDTKTDTVRPKPIKKIAIIVGCIVFVVIALFAGLSAQRKAANAKYIDELKTMSQMMLKGASEAETLGNLIKSVWSNTIHEKSSPETDPYTKSETTFAGRRIKTFNSDFNVSLQKLFADDNTIQSIQAIKENQTSVQEFYKKMQNPPKELLKQYELMETTFDSYQKFTNLIISPEGSLQTFSNSFIEYDSDMLENYKKLNLLLSDE